MINCLLPARLISSSSSTWRCHLLRVTAGTCPAPPEGGPSRGHLSAPSLTPSCCRVLPSGGHPAMRGGSPWRIGSGPAGFLGHPGSSVKFFRILFEDSSVAGSFVSTFSLTSSWCEVLPYKNSCKFYNIWEPKMSQLIVIVLRRQLSWKYWF